jgi:hypothetical protein
MPYSKMDVIFVNNNEVMFAYSNVQGGQAGIVNISATFNWEPGNIDSDPRFTDAANADFATLIQKSESWIQCLQIYLRF